MINPLRIKTLELFSVQELVSSLLALFARASVQPLDDDYK